MIMKRLMNKPFNYALWMVLFGVLSSFSIRPGGDSYTIYLGDRLLSEQRVAMQTSLPKISLQESSSNDRILVYYSHCGQIGKKRTIAFKDEQQRILKTWTFEDAKSDHTPMTVVNQYPIIG